MNLNENSRCKFVQHTLSTEKEEINTPVVAIKPPINAVFRIPKRSTRTPEIGDNTKVDHTNRDPMNDTFVSEFSLFS